MNAERASLLPLNVRASEEGACDTFPLDNERVKKGVMRAHGWLSAGANRDPKLASVEMIDALAQDVIELAGEVVRLRRHGAVDGFADSVMRQLDGPDGSPGGCPSYLTVGGVRVYCGEAHDHPAPHRGRLGGVDTTWQTEAESGR